MSQDETPKDVAPLLTMSEAELREEVAALRLALAESERKLAIEQACVQMYRDDAVDLEVERNDRRAVLEAARQEAAEAYQRGYDARAAMEDDDR